MTDNGTRPDMTLSPGVPDLPTATTQWSTELSRHQIAACLVRRFKSILSSLDHEYSLALELG